LNIPCPFCGSEELESYQHDIEDREGIPVSVVCVECGSNGPTCYIETELKKTLSEESLLEYIAEKSGWNKRVKHKTRSNTTVYCFHCNEIYPLDNLDSYTIKEDGEHIVAYCKMWMW